MTSRVCLLVITLVLESQGDLKLVTISFITSIKYFGINFICFIFKDTTFHISFLTFLFLDQNFVLSSINMCPFFAIIRDCNALVPNLSFLRANVIFQIMEHVMA